MSLQLQELVSLFSLCVIYMTDSEYSFLSLSLKAMRSICPPQKRSALPLPVALLTSFWIQLLFGFWIQFQAHKETPIHSSC